MTVQTPPGVLDNLHWERSHALTETPAGTCAHTHGDANSRTHRWWSKCPGARAVNAVMRLSDFDVSITSSNIMKSQTLECLLLMLFSIVGPLDSWCVCHSYCLTLFDLLTLVCLLTFFVWPLTLCDPHTYRLLSTTGSQQVKRPWCSQHSVKTGWSHE